MFPYGDIFLFIFLVGLAMQTMRFKFGERRNDWKCCFCCHVRTGTIFLGVWHLMLQVLALSVIAVVLRHPELMTQGPGQSVPSYPSPPGADHPPPQQQLLPTPLSKVDGDQLSPVELIITGSSHPVGGQPAGQYGPRSYATYAFGSHRNLDYQDLNVGVIVTFCTFAITLMMVYGAIKGRPSYLMPFFCLQVFDFCIASLTAVGYVCYLPDMHRVIADSPRVPFQRELLGLHPQGLALIVLFTFMIAMLVKAYFIGVVWSCYKYLTLRLVAAQRTATTIHYIDPDVQTLLPDYETAVKKFPAPPPSYAAAIATAPHPAPATTVTVQSELPAAPAPTTTPAILQAA